MKKLLLLTLILLFATLGFAQIGQGYADTTTTHSGPYVVIVPYSTVAVCAWPAQYLPGKLCTNLATTYTDITLSTPCPTARQVTGPGGGAPCSNASDVDGNFGFWVNPGSYQFMFLGTNGNVYGPFFATLALGIVSNARRINTTAPLAGGGPLTSDLTLSIVQASGTQNGYLSSADWTNFNSKVQSISVGNLSPIFTSSVAGTTSPAVSFSLSSAPGNSFLGNNTGTTGTPAYVQPSFTNLSGTIAASQLIPPGASSLGAVDAVDCTFFGSNYVVQKINTDGTSTCRPVDTGGSMTWPGVAGIANYSGTNSWNTSYSASNTIPGNFIPAASGDVSGSLATSYTTIGLDTVALDASVAAPLDQELLTYSSTLGKYVAQPFTVASAVTPNNQLLTGGGVEWTGGLNFTVAAATYQISTQLYNNPGSPQTPVTLATADPTNPRFDVIVVTASQTVVVITGTPAADPAVPSIDPTTQLSIYTVLIPAGATAPSLSNLDVYINNAEWTCNPSTSRINCASTNNPFSAPLDIEWTAATTSDHVSLVSTPRSLSAYTNLTFYIRNKASWPSTRAVAIYFLNGSTIVGNQVSFKNGLYGFGQSNVTSYQLLVVPLSAFNLGSNQVTTVSFVMAGSGGTIGFYLDNIRIQSGNSVPGVGSPVTQVTASPPLQSTGGTSPNLSCPSCNTSNATVSSFSAGGLSPLFTSTVATATTTPALSFTLANAAGGTLFGNNTASAAAPIYTAAPVLGIPGTTTGSLALASSTGTGKYTLTAPANTATPTLTLPTGSGTLASSATSPLTLDATTGALTCAACNTSAATVTSVSVGNLSPVFTASVATSTTTPAISFSLSTAAAHNFLGNNTGSAAAPSYVQPAFTDLSGSAACGQLPALSGDVTTSAGSCSTTVAKVNGATFPTSAALLSTNSSAQPVAAAAATSPISVSSSGGIACANCVAASSPGAGIAHFAGSTQTVTSSAVVGADMTANTVTSTQLAVVNTRRTCSIVVGSNDAAAALVNTNLGPQSRLCFVPAAATVVEVDVSADLGTPNVIVGKNHAGVVTNLVSSALATAVSGGIACSNTGGTTGIDTATTCGATLQNTSVAAGDYLELVSGTAGGSAKIMSIQITYTVN